MKRAFTLIEVMIVVSIIGILSAVVLPTFRNHSQKAKESAAKDNLRILRQAIEIYAAEHEDTPPGYLNGQVSDNLTLLRQLIHSTTENGLPSGFSTNTDTYPCGPYLRKLPENPFNGKTSVNVLDDAATLPATATGDYGWIYKPKTHHFKLDYPGTDSGGKYYFDY